MPIKAISFFKPFAAGQSVTPIAAQSLKRTFSAGANNLERPQHADICNARKYLGDDVPGSCLCYVA